MKKWIGFIVIQLGFIASINAQDDLIDETYLFIKPSLNFGTGKITSSGNSFTGNSRLGYGVSAEIWHPLTKSLFLAGGAGFNSRGYKDVRVMYFDVPVSLNYVIKNTFTIGGGAYWGMALGGSYRANDWTKLKFGEGSSANRSRIDNGYVVNAGYFSGMFFFMASYMGGLKNVIPKDRQTGDNSIKLNSLQGSVYIPITSLSKKKK